MVRSPFSGPESSYVRYEAQSCSSDRQSTDLSKHHFVPAVSPQEMAASSVFLPDVRTSRRPVGPSQMWTVKPSVLDPFANCNTQGDVWAMKVRKQSISGVFSGRAIGV
jgi:hypothetical protein